jgi:L-rhamnose mutarotase
LIRKAFIMKVFKDYHDEYRKRHDEIWPEMVEILHEHGAKNYSIFLDRNQVSSLPIWELKMRPYGISL